MSLRRIAGYTIVREHGRGGMGKVLQAISPEGATVALKVVTWPEAADARARWEAIERFQREARAARALSHPNICQVLDYGYDQDTFFIVMEFLDGQSVRELLDRAGPIAPRRAVEIVVSAAEGLDHAHEQGVIHRDIKPENIMVLRDGQVKLTDFGLAAVVRETTLTGPGVVMGTLFYMSPEQVRGERVDARSDIFSLGVTFYEMLTGRHAFEADRPAAVMHQILTADPPLLPTLSPHASRILRRCLQKEPDERFQSAREVVASLRGVRLDGLPQPTPMLGEAAPKPAAGLRRHPRRLPRLLSRRSALVAAAAAILAIGAITLLRPRGLVAPLKPNFPPDLKPVQQGLVATTLYTGTGQIAGLACAPDGKLLVAAGATEAVPPGVYQARPGDDWDPADAYTSSGTAFVAPGGIARYQDGRVVVADKGRSVVWMVPSPRSPPGVLTGEVPSPCDVAIAPPGFRGSKVKPGDLLVCADSSAREGRFGLYAVDPETHAVSRLAGPPALRKGLVHLEFASDGTLYAVEDTDARNACSIVTVTPEGEVARVSYELPYDPGPNIGPLALDPSTGKLYFAHGSTIYRLPAGGGTREQYAEGREQVTALEFDPEGPALLLGLLSDTGVGTVAKIAPYPIEGRLLISAAHDTKPPSGEQEFAYLMAGSSESRTPVVTPVPKGMAAGSRDLSPRAGDQVIYAAEHEFGIEPWEKSSQIWESDLAGRNPARVGEAPASRGINCLPLWSPDGRRIAFLHCDPIRGEKPCETGLDVWVMRADGTHPEHLAHPTRSQRLGSQSFPEFSWWAKDGGCELRFKYGTRGPSVNGSPDGKSTVAVRTKEGKVGGEPGVWRQLCIGDARGRNEQVRVQWFVKDSDIARYLRRQNLDADDAGLKDDVREWVGPIKPRWSPSGKQVAFLAAYPFRPEGRFHKYQLEVWVYDLSTGILAKLTDDDDQENRLSWQPEALPAEVAHRGR